MGELAQVAAVRDHRGVRAHGDLHALGDRRGDVLLGDPGPADLLLVVVRLHRGLVDAVEDRGERRDDERAPLAREFTGLRRHAVAVLDAGDTAADGVEDARGALRVRGDRAAAVPGQLLDDRTDLVLGQALVVWVVVGARHAARGTHLDDIGARAQQLADGEPHLVRGVGDLAHPGARVEAALGGEVGVAAGVTEDADRRVDARTCGEPLGHGRAVAGGQTAQVADRGDTRVEGGAQPLRGAEHLDRGVLLVAAHHLARGLDTEVDVGVDEAGEEGAASGVDGVYAGQGVRRRRGGPRVGDEALGVDDERGVLDGRGAGAVDQAGVGDTERGKLLGTHERTLSDSAMTNT